MSLRLADFLCKQGIDKEKITILVTYGAQKEKILSYQLYNNLLSGSIHVTTVDNYQGQENDIIILSLVRNNQNGAVGFLRISNRICVALSRARHGFFIFGNIEVLSRSGSSLWVHAKKILSRNKELGSELILRCDRHPRQIVKVSVKSNQLICLYIRTDVDDGWFCFFSLGEGA